MAIRLWEDARLRRACFLLLVFFFVFLVIIIVNEIAVFLDDDEDRKSTRLNSSHQIISYAVFCLKKKSFGLFPIQRKDSRDLSLKRHGTQTWRAVSYSRSLRNPLNHV